MIDNEIIAEANALARDFYGLMGYGVPKGYRFHRATHPKERLCWQMAVVAFERLRQTDVERDASNRPGNKRASLATGFASEQAHRAGDEASDDG
jgi:hypothetical protein